MKIIPPCLIPIFYWKEDLDSFFAAQGIKSFLEKNPAEPVPVSKGDTIEGLENKYPIFAGVRFTEMLEMPDMSQALNVVFISRYDQIQAALAERAKLPTRQHLAPAQQKKMANGMLYRMECNNLHALTRMGYEAMSNRKRANEVMPDFVKHLISLFEKPTLTDDEEMFVAGVAKHETLLASDYPKFKEDIIKSYTDPRQRPKIDKELIENGKSKLEEADRMVRMMIERSAMLSEFAGHKVKIVNLPAELSDKAGWLLAKNMPFSVVFEDILKENKRIYRLYSDRGGLNVLEIAAQYRPEGNARYVTFTANIDFTNHKFI